MFDRFSGHISVRFVRQRHVTDGPGGVAASSCDVLLCGSGGGDLLDVVEGFAGVGGLPPTDGVRLSLAEGTRAVVRPSGTEPKLKCYLEVVVPVNPEDGVEAARIAAAGRLDALRGDIKAAAGI